VYLILFLIDALASPPVSCAEDPDHVAPAGEPDGDNSIAHLSEAVVALLGATVRKIFRNDAASIRESDLCLRERNAMLLPVGPVLPLVPVEADLRHDDRLARIGACSHTIVWHAPVIGTQRTRFHRTRQ
jgi:hypothetical protein